jgi:protein-L-isoaspartate O-methyltransferase
MTIRAATLDSAEALEILLNHVADKPIPMARLAWLLLANGQGERARKLCARAIALAPHNAEVNVLAAEVFSHGVLPYYFPLVQDTARHKLYNMAFRRAIRQGSHVLDIGAGTGLFAMMAARAGAAEVVACEANPAVAAAASEIVTRNNLTNRVRVVAKHSSDLEIGIDLMRPVDVLVWDNLARNLIGAGALTAIERAVRCLVRPGARIIPAKGAIRIALAEDKKACRTQMHVVEGFDLSAFNRLAAPYYRIRVGDERLALRSKPDDLFCFDFQSGGPFPEGRACVSLSASGGRVNGIAQWVRLEVEEQAQYENCPFDNRTSSLSALFYPLMQPVEMARGDTLTVYGSHDRRSLRVWGEASQRG